MISVPFKVTIKGNLGKSVPKFIRSAYSEVSLHSTVNTPHYWLITKLLIRKSKTSSKVPLICLPP